MKARWMAGLVVAFSTAVLASMSVGLRTGSAQPAAGVSAGEGNDLTPEQAKAAQEQNKADAPAPAATKAPAQAQAQGGGQAADPAAAPAEEQKEEKSGCCG
ncbi:MAG: hypothetical protein AAB578_11075 [Elusimicrobiota bacterium]